VLSFLGLGFTIVATISLDGGTHVSPGFHPPGPYPFVSDVSPGFRTDKLKKRTWVAIVRVQRVYGEPSGMGGDYLTFEVVRVLRGPESSRVGVGGHSWTSHATKGDLYLASLSRDSTFVDKPFPPYWGGVPTIDAVVSGMIRVNTIEDGVRLFKELQTADSTDSKH
jgi:hypothetical protein